MTIQAIYEDGVFKPTEPVHIAERTRVAVILPTEEGDDLRNQEEIFALLKQSSPSGQIDTAERHNEHQP